MTPAEQGPPLVSVITPTWCRNDLLAARCIPSVRAQTYPRVEHVIVSDGPDLVLRGVFAAMSAPPVYSEIAGHDPTPHYGHHARRRGLELASGDLICYLDDDDAYRPHHVATLAAALQACPDAMWAYSAMTGREAAPRRVFGCDPPRCGQIGTPMLMHRRNLLAQWGPASDVEDWRVVERWLATGVPYVFVNDVTVDVWPQ